MDDRPFEERIQQLRQWRNPRERDYSLGFLQADFKNQIEKPYKQLGKFIPIWQSLIPSPYQERTALVGFSRNVLLVHVADSSTCYHIDRLLRAGVEQELRRQAGMTLRRVQLKVAAIE